MPAIKHHRFLIVFAFLATLILAFSSLKTSLVQAAQNNNKIQLTVDSSGNLTISQDSNDFNGNYNVFDVPGNLIMNSDLHPNTKSKTLVIFVNGFLNISQNIAHPDANSGLVFVVKGNVNIDKSVTQIDAVIIAEGIICTACDSTQTSPYPASNVTASQLTINGSLVSLNQTDTAPIKFRRSLGANDGTTPAELINYQPKYLVILRNMLSDTYQKWSEVQ